MSQTTTAVNRPSRGPSVRRAWLALVAVALGPVACAPTLASSRGEQATAEQVQGPHAPVGTRIAVRIRTPVDAPLGAAIPRFEADVVEPVLTTRGDVLVPAGAAVRGTIVWTGSNTRVQLDDATVETPVGAVPLHATVRGAAIRHALAGPDRSPEDRDDAMVARGSPAVATSGGQVRSRVGDSGVATAPSARFVLPSGTEVRLVLTQPLLAPSASVLVYH